MASGRMLTNEYKHLAISPYIYNTAHARYGSLLLFRYYIMIGVLHKK
ncbi:hypothetical protein XBFM1_1150002 [Xenorhabdus bovienii str. feltiae Moldova]|uniref:Uncharacterized protein n=1 Tax=Xenorhabdus bovienii str. feltiae Moldova TaxID=1398200 RepID=A0A077NC42_XENBV|nr:hypothetical protein XBFM1_1150002 [Xenorhabdus bovienii str. feltiae Moldova]